MNKQIAIGAIGIMTVIIYLLTLLHIREMKELDIQLQILQMESLEIEDPKSETKWRW